MRAEFNHPSSISVDTSLPLPTAHAAEDQRWIATTTAAPTTTTCRDTIPLPIYSTPGVLLHGKVASCFLHRPSHLICLISRRMLYLKRQARRLEEQQCRTDVFLTFFASTVVYCNEETHR
jgi:hypothetical protein